jgi:cytidylate kinase
MDLLVESQLKKWRARISKGKDESIKKGPVLTISRETGSGGSKIARKLADELKMDLIGGHIIQHVAESAKMSRKVIESLDEKAIPLRDTWLSALFESKHLWPDQYLGHLTKVIGTIGAYGDAIVMGRGAQYILPHESTFRIRIIAPLEFRIENTVRDFKYTKEQAESYVVKTEADRRAFIRKYFHADVTDPTQYDIVVNTHWIGMEGAAKAILVAFKSWMEHFKRES